MILTKPYDRERAVAYAKRWALDRNPLFINFTGQGGDCTSFASQSLLAGSCTMDYTVDFGWYYISPNDRAPAWSSVEYFYDFLTGVPAFAENNAGIGPYGTDARARDIEVGDFIQLATADGDYYHTLVITGFEPNDILVSAHTNDALDRPLSSYNFSSARFLHFEGVRLEINDDRCFEILLSGGLADGAQPADDGNG